MAPRPPTGEITEDLYESLGPWAWRDTADEVWWLLDLCEGIVGGSRLQVVESIIRDSDEGPGWSSVMDLDRAPSGWLPWLAQFVGVRVRTSLSDADQRLQIQGTANQKRGSALAMQAAALPYLTGNKYIILKERVGGNAWALGVRTLVDETPDPARVEQALREQKPAGIVLDYDTVPGQTYDTLRLAFDTYDDVEAEYPTYDDLRDNLP